MKLHIKGVQLTYRIGITNKLQIISVNSRLIVFFHIYHIRMNADFEQKISCSLADIICRKHQNVCNFWMHMSFKIRFRAPSIPRGLMAFERGWGVIIAHPPSFFQLWDYQKLKTETLHSFCTKDKLKSHFEQFQVP